MTDRCQDHLEQKLVLLIFLLECVHLAREVGRRRVNRVTITKRAVHVDQFTLDTVRFRGLKQRGRLQVAT